MASKKRPKRRSGPSGAHQTRRVVVQLRDPDGDVRRYQELAAAAGMTFAESILFALAEHWKKNQKST